MQELILHIGMHKTGTTAIQSALAEYDDGETRMARVGPINHSIFMNTLFSDEKYEYHIHKNMGRSRSDIDAMQNQWLEELAAEIKMPRKRLIISGEKMSLLDRESVSRIKEYFSNRVHRVRVIAYVREPVSFAASMLQQHIKGGRATLSIPRPCYRDRFEKYIELFGREAVDFVLYDPAAMVDGSVVSDFCERIGITKPVNPSVAEENNVSLSSEATQLTYLFNRDGMKSFGSESLHRSRTIFVSKLKELFPGSSFNFSASRVMESADNDDIEWMERVSQFNLRPGGKWQHKMEPSDRSGFEHSITNINAETVEKLQKAVAAIDPIVGESRNSVELLNFLFMSIYFQRKYEAIPNGCEDLPSRIQRISRKLANDRTLVFSDIKALLRVITLWRPVKVRTPAVSSPVVSTPGRD